MKGFNPTEWAIRHKALSIYFMLVCLGAGFAAYQSLGRNEDPEFTVKTMVVQTLWPGATQEETMQQVTDRIEKKLQDTPNLQYLKSYTVAGQSTIFVYLLESTPKEDVPDLWYQVRKKVGDIQQTLPQGVVGPFFNDEFGDTYGIIYGFTADGFSHRELRDYAEEARSRLLRVKDVSKAEFLGTQDERIYVEFSTHRLAELGMDRMELVQALVTQNAVVPSGVIQTKNEAVLMDVTGRFQSEKDLEQVNFAFGGKMLRLGDIATITRRYADPPQPKFRVNGKDAIGVALSMRAGGDILALEKNLHHAMEELKADLPVGIETFLVSNQPKVVEEAVDEFMKALWEAIAIVLVISFLNLGWRAGLVVAASIPLVLAIVFIVMQICGIDLQRISLGALIIALGLLVDDAMITIETMVSKVEHGWDSIKAAIFAYASTAYPRLTGTLVIALGFVPVGFAKSSAGEYTFTLFAVVVIAVITSWVVAALFTPLIGTMLLKPPKRQGHGQGPPREWRAPPPSLSSPAALHDASRQNDASGDDRDVRRVALAGAVCAQPVLSRVGPAGTRARSAPEARRLDLRIGYGLTKARRNPPCRPRDRPLEFVRWARGDSILPAARRAAPKRFLRPNDHSYQELEGAGTSQETPRGRASGKVPRSGRACLPARARPTGGLAGPVPAQRHRSA